MTEVQHIAIQTALSEMLNGGHFSICVVDKILGITGGVPNAGDYRILSLLHCVKFMDFPPRLRVEFPMLLQRVISSPHMNVVVLFGPLESPQKFSQMQIASN